MGVIGPPSLLADVDRALDAPACAGAERLAWSRRCSPRVWSTTAVLVVDPDQIVAESAGGIRALYVALTRPTQRLVTLDAAPGADWRRSLGSPGSGSWVKKCSPGAPPASSSSHSSVASWMPTSRTGGRVVGDRVQPVDHRARQGRAGQLGEPLRSG